MSPTLSVVAAVNDEETLEQNLAASPALKSKKIPLLIEKGYASAGLAYNAGINVVESDIVILAHQDVYIPEGWDEKLQDAIRRLEKNKIDWGVIGIFGMQANGQIIGRVWSTGLGKEIGKKFNTIQPIVTIDELLIIIRKKSGLTFDEKLPGFHLYGTDIVQSALVKGLGAYVIHAPVIHNSKPVRKLDHSYWSAYQYERKKWEKILPIPTCIVPITRFGWPKYKYHLSMLKSKMLGIHPKDKKRGNAKVIAKQLGYE